MWINRTAIIMIFYPNFVFLPCTINISSCSINANLYKF